jgi:hypothetical protein
MFLITSNENRDFTEEWAIQRIIHHMDENRPDHAKALAQEWGIDWPDCSDPFV